MLVANHPTSREPGSARGAASRQSTEHPRASGGANDFFGQPGTSRGTTLLTFYSAFKNSFFR